MKLFQYQGKTEPISTSPETPQIDKWVPEYPNIIYRRAVLATAIISACCFLGDIPRSEEIDSSKWQPTYPVQLYKRLEAQQPQLQFVYSPPPPAPPEPDHHKPPKPPKPPKKDDLYRASLYATHFATDDLSLTAHEAVFLEKWIPTFPDRLDRAQRSFWQGQSVTDPTLTNEIPDIVKWKPLFVDRLDPIQKPFWEGYITTDPTVWLSIYIAAEWRPIFPDRLDPAKRPFWSGWQVINFFSHSPLFCMKNLESPITSEACFNSHITDEADLNSKITKEATFNGNLCW